MKFFHKKNNPPGPPWWMGGVNLLRMNGGGQVDFFRELMERYGPMVRFRVLHKEAWLVSDPDLARHVSADRQIYESPRFIQSVLAELVGKEGIVTTRGCPWKENRDAINPAMHKSNLEQGMDVIHRNAKRFVDRLKECARQEDVVDVLAHGYDFALQTASEVLFMDFLTSEEVERFRDCLDGTLEEAFRRLNNPLSELTKLLPFGGQRRHAHATTRLHRLIRERFERQRGNGAANDATTTFGMLHEELKSGRMTEERVVNNLLQLYIAGHESTGVAISWLIYHLSEHPEIYEYLEDEVASVRDYSVRLHDLNHALPRLFAVVKESMRLKSPVNAAVREADADNEVGGYFVAKGALIFIGISNMNTDKRFWGETVDKFLPDDHFMNNPGADRYVLPFGSGPHRCWGASLAILEIANLLKEIVANSVHFDLVGEVRERNGITRKPIGLHALVRM
jgi:cytochrome P450